MENQSWEEKWDDFKNEDVRNEIEQDSQQEAEHRKIFDWIKAHEEEVKNAIQQDHRSDIFPKDDVFSFEFNMNIEGHEVYWRWEEALSRDGDEESDGEFEIDGREPESKVSWDIDQYLVDLCSEMI